MKNENIVKLNKVSTCIILLLFFCCFFPLSGNTAKAAQYPVNQRLTWEGVSWGVFPSKSNCPTSNAWLDDAGQLHMLLQKNAGVWCGISLENPTKVLYGKMIWKVSSNSLNFETGTTFSPFTYTNDSHELDIEINKWPGYDYNAWFSNQPASIDNYPQHIHYGITSDSPYYNATDLTYTIDWQPNYVYYSITTSSGAIVLDWRYTNASDIPDVAATVMVDILTMPYGGPVSGNPQEVVLSHYQFIAAGSPELPAEEDDSTEPPVAEDGSSSSSTRTLTIANGVGSGDYTAGTSVEITANAPPDGMLFNRWTGNTENLSDPYSPTTTYTASNQATTVVATYKDIPYPVTISNPLKVNNFTDLVNNLLKWLLSIAGGLGFIVIIIGGIMYIVSAGDEQKAMQGKKIVTSAIIGIAFILLSYSIIRLVDEIFVG